MRSQEPQLAAYRFHTDDKREAIPPSPAPEIYQRKPITLPSSLCKPSLRAYFDWDDSGNEDYSKRPLLLDLFAGGGGAAMGYCLAGFRVVGVDIEPQPHYPFEFHQADALTFPLEGFDVIHASPPCQRFSRASNIHGNPKDRHPDLVAPTRLRCLAAGVPFVIENVPGAPLDDPIMLCGTMFEGLRVYRHRLFECHGFDAVAPGKCNHNNHTHRMGRSKGEYHTLDKSPYITCVGHNFQAKSGRIAMQIDWMTRGELSQAIPPAYTEWIGRQILRRMAAPDSA